MDLYQPFYKQAAEKAAEAFPSLSQTDPVAWDHLISPHVIELPFSVYKKAHTAIEALYSISRRDSYRRLLNMPETFQTGNDSVLMAYDFHTDMEGGVHLVEINTNAAGFLLAATMNSVHDDHAVLAAPQIAALHSSFVEEAGMDIPRIAIVDDELSAQKMYPEFLMYRDLFSAWKWPARIGEAGDLKFTERLSLGDFEADFVYNRSTDFYLREERHSELSKAYEARAVVVSPQPKEYFLLADKERLTDFSRTGWLEKAGASDVEISAIREVLLPTFNISDFGSSEEIWAQRKGLFFKPKNSFGGKSAYRGESVSKKVFDRLIQENSLIQKYAHPQRPPEATSPEHPLWHWKFDVRFYVYKQHIQQISARLYQGQVTNFSSPFGGFSRVAFG